MKIVTIVGARPQFVKAAVVSRALAAHPGVEEVLVHTGQHYDEQMSGVFFSELGMSPPACNLEVGSGTQGAQTGRMLEAIEQVLLEQRPDWVLVFGDTNSTLAGALAAAKLHVRVAHVEAGLRSFNRSMPEEVNRVLTDHASELLFAPTEAAVENLCREGLPPERVHLVGDVMYDAALFYAEVAAQRSDLPARLGLLEVDYILATVHRAENTDNAARLRAIFEGLRRVAREYAVVVPLHPRTRGALARTGEGPKLTEGLLLTDPLGYLDMVSMESHARVIATDSGGVQKEAYFYGVPCVTLREETEWVELVTTGWNRLTPPVSAEGVAEAILEAVGTRGRVGALYGQGNAAERTVAILCDG